MLTQCLILGLWRDISFYRPPIYMSYITPFQDTGTLLRKYTSIAVFLPTFTHIMPDLTITSPVHSHPHPHLHLPHSPLKKPADPAPETSPPSSSAPQQQTAQTTRSGWSWASCSALHPRRTTVPIPPTRRRAGFQQSASAFRRRCRRLRRASTRRRSGIRP